MKLKNWTPSLIARRIEAKLYQLRHPACPWLTPDANRFLDSWLKCTDIGLEWGSGRSTIWFARRTKHITSIEHDKRWFDKISVLLAAHSFDNVKYIHAPCSFSPDEHSRANETEYVSSIDQFAFESLDYILVDGVYRDSCAFKAIDKVRPGGIIIIDNVNWFIPSDSKSPDARTFAMGPQSGIWNQFMNSTNGWRHFWSTNGLGDTAIFFKP